MSVGSDGNFFVHRINLKKAMEVDEHSESERITEDKYEKKKNLWFLFFGSRGLRK